MSYKCLAAYSVLSLSKFTFNIRFQIAVLVCSIDTERNRNNPGDAKSGAACLLEILVLFKQHLVHARGRILISTVRQAVCSPAMPAGFPCFPVVKFHTFLASQLCIGASSLKMQWQLFCFEKWENLCCWSHWRVGLSGFRSLNLRPQSSWVEVVVEAGKLFPHLKQQVVQAKNPSFEQGRGNQFSLLAVNKLLIMDFGVVNKSKQRPAWRNAPQLLSGHFFSFLVSSPYDTRDCQYLW